MVHFDTLSMEIRVNRLPRDPECPMCGERPTITTLIDYEEFCGLRAPGSSPSSPHAA
jgi:adenylyltransferase/sulfurtransferase